MNEKGKVTRNIKKGEIRKSYSGTIAPPKSKREQKWPKKRNI